MSRGIDRDGTSTNSVKNLTSLIIRKARNILIAKIKNEFASSMFLINICTGEFSFSRMKSSL